LGELAAITKTDAAGKATATLTSKQAGTATVTAIVSSTSEKNAATVDFTADVYSIAHSSFDLSHTERVADGVQAAMLRVALKDVQGNPVAGKASSISVAQSGLTGLVLPSSFIESNTGVYTAQLTSTIAGKANISATVDSSAFAQQSLTFIANVSTAKIADVKPMRAGTLTVGDKLTYRAEIKDANDNPLGSGIPVHWSVNSDTLISGGKVISLTDHAGMAEIEISRDVQGDALVTATVGNNSKLATAVNFTRGNLDIYKSKLTLLRKEIIANGVDIATLQVDISDNKGNPLPHLESQITTSPKDGEQGLKIETVANPSGGYLVNIKGTKAGGYAVTVFAAGNALPNKVNVVLMGDSTTAKLQAINVNKTTFKANDVDQVIYTAEVVDVHNNPLENYSVSWSLAKGEGTYDGQSYTNTMGIAETSLRANRLGEYKMDVWVRGNKNSAQAVNSTAGDVDPQKSGFAINVASIDASGKTKAKLTVTLKDKFDNILTGQQVNIRDISKLSGLVIIPQIMMDNNDGTYSAEVSATKKGNAKFIARINGVDLIDEPQLRIGNIIPQLSFDNKNVTKIYTKAIQPKQLLRGLPPKITTYWSSDNTDIATVNAATGEIKLLKAGIVNIAATTLPNENYAVGQASYQLEVERADPGLKFQQPKQNREWGEILTAHAPIAENVDADISGLTLNWEIDNSAVATIDAKNGEITTKKPDTAQVTVKSVQDDRFKASSATYMLVVNKKLFPISFKKPTVQSKITDNVSLQSPDGSSIPNIAWSSSDNNVLTVDQNGSNVTINSPGRVVLTASVAENDLYMANSNNYVQEIYGKPVVSLGSISKWNNNKETSSGQVWTPVYDTDKIQVRWSSPSNSPYDKAQKVRVSLMDGPNELAAKEQLVSKNSEYTTEFDPKASYIGNSLKVQITAFGYDTLESQQASQPYRVEGLSPKDIWEKANMKSRVVLVSWDGSENECRRTGANGERYVVQDWGFQLTFPTTSHLLSDMVVTLETYSTANASTIKNITRHRTNTNFNKELNGHYGGSSYNNDMVVKAECWTNHEGRLNPKLQIDYQGVVYTYTRSSMYWNGTGDGQGWSSDDFK
jgi:adhesin/invasin